MFCQLNFGIGLVAFVLFMNGFVGINGQYSYAYCDNDYNTSSCANTTLEGNIIYKCRGFLSCKDSTVDTSYDLFCQGDRSCKNLVYTNDDDDELWAFGYQAADSLVMTDEANYAYCYGYQSCLDIVFDQSDTGNDAEAHGYQAMYNAYIDYSDTVQSNGYQGLYYATINTTDVLNNELDITVYGYYGSYETDILCQDGMTCNFYAYGYYATKETYLYCMSGATCNVYCGDTNGCVGMNIYCYSTATCYFDCDDATECPSETDAYSVMALLTKDEANINDGKIRYSDEQFNEIMQDRLNKKYDMQYEYKQERLREERNVMKMESVRANKVTNGNSNTLKSKIIESGIILIVGMFIGILLNCGYNKFASNKEYAYESIV